MSSKYDSKSHRCQLITRKLAVYVGSTRAPLSLIENKEFLSLVITLDPQYPVTSRTLSGREIDKVMLDLRSSCLKCKGQLVHRHLDKTGDDLI